MLLKRALFTYCYSDESGSITHNNFPINPPRKPMDARGLVQPDFSPALTQRCGNRSDYDRLVMLRKIAPIMSVHAQLL